MGNEVTLLALQPPTSADPPSYDLSGCKMILLPNPIRLGAITTRLKQRIFEFLWPHCEYYEAANNIVKRTAFKLLKHEPFDCMITTCSPLGSLHVANILHKRFGIPWLADIRDLPDQFDPQRKDWDSRRKALSLAAACRGAAHMSVVSPPLKTGLEDRYKPQCPVSVIYNGYNEEELKGVENPKCSTFFDISYFGSVYAGRSPALVQQGLEILINRGVNLKNVRVLFYGSDNLADLNIQKQLPSAALFHAMQNLPHGKALSAMRSSSILLSLSSPKSKGILTSKIFEYAMIGHPVLSVPRDNDVLDEFVCKANIGRACDTAEEAAEFIHKYLDSWRRTGCLPDIESNTDYISQFSRRAQAEKLNKILIQLQS